MRIKMTSVFVTNPIDAHTFYTETLGFTSFMFMPEHRLAIVTSPEDPGGVALMLEPNENPIAGTYQSGLYAAGIPVITFGTADVQKEFERLTGKGVTFRTPPRTSEWGTDAVFEDGFGNLIQMHQD